MTRAKSHLEELLAIELRCCGLDGFEREWVFAPPRRYRFDFAWPHERLAVEVEGGIHIRGRHTRPAGYAADCAKYNLAVLCGWRVLRFTGEMVRGGTAAEQIGAALGGQRHWQNTGKPARKSRG